MPKQIIALHKIDMLYLYMFSIRRNILSSNYPLEPEISVIEKLFCKIHQTNFFSYQNSSALYCTAFARRQDSETNNIAPILGDPLAAGILLLHYRDARAK